VLLAFGFPPTVTAQHDRLLAWADARIAVSDGPREASVSTTVSDYFGKSPYATRRTPGNGLAAGGRRAPTAASGSFWVYDPVHGIAAGSEYGDVHGDRIMYAPAPPVAVPRRDLSGVVSPLGLHLGSTSTEAARILRVSLSAVKRIGPHRSTLYARADRRCGKDQCAHDAIIIFADDRATSISLADIAP
jgi:hypothetical protein